MTNFNQAAVKTLYADLKSLCMATNLFPAGTITHDPISPPGQRLACTIGLGPIVPITSSGLASVSGKVTFHIRIWSSMLQRALDDIDPEILTAVCTVIGAICGAFTLSGTVRNIDLFGLSGQPAYADFEGKQYRVFEISVPIEINDMFTEVALWAGTG